MKTAEFGSLSIGSKFIYQGLVFERIDDFTFVDENVDCNAEDTVNHDYWVFDDNNIVEVIGG